MGPKRQGANVRGCSGFNRLSKVVEGLLSKL